MGNSSTHSQTSQQRENEENISKEKVYLNVYTLPADEIPKFLSVIPGLKKK